MRQFLPLFFVKRPYVRTAELEKFFFYLFYGGTYSKVGMKGSLELRPDFAKTTLTQQRATQWLIGKL